MRERFSQLLSDGVEIVFMSQEGELALATTQRSEIANLVKERESLGERVVVITDALGAERLIQIQQRQRRRSQWLLPQFQILF